MLWGPVKPAGAVRFCAAIRHGNQVRNTAITWPGHRTLGVGGQYAETRPDKSDLAPGLPEPPIWQIVARQMRKTPFATESVEAPATGR